jgi:hypothetical protein
MHPGCTQQVFRASICTDFLGACPFGESNEIFSTENGEYAEVYLLHKKVELATRAVDNLWAGAQPRFG